jgi:hypothetical protein
MRVKFGPTVAQFRGEAKLAYDHAARRCTIEGRGIDGRGASRANASGVVEATGTVTTLLRVEGTFNVTGVHLARAILAEFAENVAKLVAEPPAGIANPAREEKPPMSSERLEENPHRAEPGWIDAQTAPAAGRPAAPELSGGKLLWRMLRSWLRQVFLGKREAR